MNSTLYQDFKKYLLRPLNDFPVDLKQVGSLKCLVSKILVVEVAVVDDGRVQTFGILLDDVVVVLGDHGSWPTMGLHVEQVGHHFTKDLFRLLVEV